MLVKSSYIRVSVIDEHVETFICRLENYQALLWGIFQTGKFLWEKATLSFTMTYQAMQDCNL